MFCHYQQKDECKTTSIGDKIAFTDIVSQMIRVLGFYYLCAIVHVRNDWVTVLKYHHIKGIDAKLVILNHLQQVFFCKVGPHLLTTRLLQNFNLI